MLLSICSQKLNFCIKIWQEKKGSSGCLTTWSVVAFLKHDFKSKIDFYLRMSSFVGKSILAASVYILFSIFFEGEFNLNVMKISQMKMKYFEIVFSFNLQIF